MEVTPGFIDGAMATTHRTYQNIDPSTSQVIGDVASFDADAVDSAVKAARREFPSWRRTTPEARATLMGAIADGIEAESEELARLESEDTGKPLSQARNDVRVSARYFRFYGHAIDSYYGVTIPLDTDYHAYTTREPHGVTGHIVAWNYPLQLLSRGVAPALATGNCVVAKPASETPRSAVALARIAAQAGLPAGVFSVVTGPGREVGTAIAEHPDIDHIAFVGSTDVGRIVGVAAANRVAPAVLELGGKSPHLVFPDADIESTSEVIARAILQNAGQTCSAGSRVLVHETVHDAVVDTVAEKFRGMRIGPGWKDLDLGPLISKKQQSRVSEYIDSIRSGEVVVGGVVPDDDDLSQGAYFTPTLVDGVDPSESIAQEEIFGPVLVVNTFSTEDEAIALANGTEYALLGAVWTRDISRAHRIASQVEAGQVYVNTYGAAGGVELPFGGLRKSGFGREKGREALDAYTATKTIVVRL